MPGQVASAQAQAVPIQAPYSGAGEAELSTEYTAVVAGRLQDDDNGCRNFDAGEGFTFWAPAYPSLPQRFPSHHQRRSVQRHSSAAQGHIEASRPMLVWFSSACALLALAATVSSTVKLDASRLVIPGQGRIFISIFRQMVR